MKCYIFIFCAFLLTPLWSQDQDFDALTALACIISADHTDRLIAVRKIIQYNNDASAKFLVDNINLELSLDGGSYLKTLSMNAPCFYGLYTNKNSLYEPILLQRIGKSNSKENTALYEKVLRKWYTREQLKEKYMN